MRIIRKLVFWGVVVGAAYGVISRPAPEDVRELFRAQLENTIAAGEQLGIDGELGLRLSQVCQISPAQCASAAEQSYEMRYTDRWVFASVEFESILSDRSFNCLAVFSKLYCR